MATSTESKPQSADDALAARDPKLLIHIYEMMVLTRAVEDRMVAMYKSGDLLGSLYTGHWHEAISVGSAAALRDGDYMAPIHRDLGAHLCRGMEPWQVMASFMGKATSPTGGRDGTLHYGRLDLGIYNLPSHIPANFPVATGMAFAAKYRGEDRVCLAFCGDGSTSRADFHEALNMAGALTLPCIFVVENNQFAYSTPVSMQTASQDFAGKAAAYGFPGVKVDGTDAVAVYDAVDEAVTRARKGDGPTLIEAVTMRMVRVAEKPRLGRGRLLQRRGGEGRSGIALGRLGFDRGERGEGRAFEQARRCRRPAPCWKYRAFAVACVSKTVEARLEAVSDRGVFMSAAICQYPAE